jgi:predicted transglutaminase-like cysteine proteinase
MGAFWRQWRLLPLAATLALFAAGAGTSTEASGVASMATGGLTSQPIGHYEFCREFPAECAIRTRDYGPLEITNASWRRIQEINLAVNREVTPMSDYEIYGKDEYWAYPDHGVGDCEDYVLEKRRRLAHAGMPLSTLLITVVRKQDGEGHAVLTVRTDRGDLILDNLHDEIKLWHKTGYRFLKRQSTGHTGRWVTLREDQNMLVGSVN